jgi:hypothetical protein
MRHHRSRFLSAAASLFAVALVGGAFVAGVSMRESASASNASERTTPGLKLEPEGAPSPALTDFPTNQLGMTYGSDAKAESLKDSPDLVAVVGDSGVFGYARKDDLTGHPRFNTLEEAHEWQKKHGNTPVVISVFDQEGVNVVDTFTMSVPEVGYGPGRG